MSETFQKGDYVLATKYRDGDTGDQYAVGFYDHEYDHFGQTRFMVVNGDGKQYRGNGFRRCERITEDEGRWLIARFDLPLTEWVGEDDERRPIGTTWDWLANAREALSTTPK